MSISTQSKSNLCNAIAEMAKQFTTIEETAATDFHFQVNSGSGTLTIFDDDDNVLASTTIDEWATPDDDNHIAIERALRKALEKAQADSVLDNMNVLKPYSCVLVDDDKETIVDLLYVDDDTYIISDDLLKGFDEEMDEFLKKLLEE